MARMRPGGLGEETRRMAKGAAGSMSDAASWAGDTAAQATSVTLDGTLEGMRQIRARLEGLAEGLPTAPTSTRLAWRAGRWLGRVEGVVWLGSKGFGVWWGKARKRLRNQPTNERVRMAVQWGPCVVATAWLCVQLVGRVRRGAEA